MVVSESYYRSRDSGFGTWDSECRTRGSGFGTRDSGLGRWTSGWNLQFHVKALTESVVYRRRLHILQPDAPGTGAKSEIHE
jgi:hypothetical protein